METRGTHGAETAVGTWAGLTVCVTPETDEDVDTGCAYSTLETGGATARTARKVMTTEPAVATATVTGLLGVLGAV